MRVDCRPVRCGVLDGEPAIEAALREVAASGARELLVYPFFMSDGYFVSKVLSARIAGLGGKVPPCLLTPLGLDPGLPAVMMKRALACARGAGFAPAETRLLVVGQGSRSDRASAQATIRMAEELEGMGAFLRASSAFLEEPPFIVSRLASEKTPVVVSGFFAGNGTHSACDVPAAIEESGVRAVYAGPVGTHPDVRDLVVAACERHGAGVT